MNASSLESLRKATLFLDNNISGTAVSRMLRAQGLRVLALSGVFVGRSEVGDGEWLERVGLRKWIAFTDDRRIIRRHAHFLANSDVRLFVIKFKYGNGKQLAYQLRGRLEEINSCCRGRAPFVYELYPNNIARVDLRKVFLRSSPELMRAAALHGFPAPGDSSYKAGGVLSTKAPYFYDDGETLADPVQDFGEPAERIPAAVGKRPGLGRYDERLSDSRDPSRSARRRSA